MEGPFDRSSLAFANKISKNQPKFLLWRTLGMKKGTSRMFNYMVFSELPRC